MPRMSFFKTHKDYLIWYREYRKKNIKKLRRYGKLYNKIYRMKHGYHNEVNSKKRYPLKEKARQKLHQAIYSGKIDKKPCEVCGKKKYIQAHHSDYSKPLEVTWLCAIHHAEEHKKLKLTPTHL